MDSVSIIMPVFNEQNIIKRSLAEIQKQDYKGNLEIIIIDDGSTDDSFKIAKEIASKDKRIKIIQNKTNLGLAESTNLGALKSKNKIVCMLLADYVLKNKNWLTKAVSFMRKNNAEIVMAPLELPEELFEKYSFINKLDSFSPILSLKAYEDRRGGRLVLFDRKVFKKITFDESYKFCGEDTDFKIRARNEGFRFADAPSDLVIEHHHGNRKKSITGYLKKAIQVSESNGILFRKYGFLPNTYRNEITNGVVFLGLFFPYVQEFCAFLILAEAVIYSYLFYRVSKDLKSILLIPFKILKNLLSVIFFIKGFITLKQTRF